MKFIPRWLVTSLAVGLAIWIVPGMSIVGGTAIRSVAALGLILALVDSCVKPLLQLLSLPLTILTFGIFHLVVNALMLELAAWFTNGIFNAGIYISGFFSAFLAAIVVSIASAIFGSFVDKD